MTKWSYYSVLRWSTNHPRSRKTLIGSRDRQNTQYFIGVSRSAMRSGADRQQLLRLHMALKYRTFMWAILPAQTLLFHYIRLRTEKFKRNAPFDALVQKDLNIKREMLDIMRTDQRDSSEAILRINTNIERLTTSIPKSIVIENKMCDTNSNTQ
ncbi:unnamed protein product [Lepeophtheirus salmonis]|uniref:(salmon louse) hypothetical protein n=1 Tax=Lepeophtheirus salmonis TaxID=72036 RepID=A0A7R8GZR1_LEPSM|nr:unnamed protein product [Lepeophtheirus salmonis]CAF2756442.1 unnamed protein product [Lepeophtheirus salmonis]